MKDARPGALTWKGAFLGAVFAFVDRRDVVAGALAGATVGYAVEHPEITQRALAAVLDKEDKRGT